MPESIGAVTHTMVNGIFHGKLCRGASHLAWVLVYRVNQRSHVTEITNVERNLTQFIGGKFNHNFISIEIGSCTSVIKTPFQLTTLSV